MTIIPFPRPAAATPSDTVPGPTTGPCPVWCVDDFDPSGEGRGDDRWIVHHGPRQEILTRSVDRSRGEDDFVIDSPAQVWLSRLDIDDPDSAVTGYAMVNVEIGSPNPMIPVDALRLAETIADQARIAMASEQAIAAKAVQDVRQGRPVTSTPHTLPVFTPRHGPGDDGVYDVTVGGARAGYIRPYGTGWLAVADLDPIHYSRHDDHEIDAFAVFYTLPQVGWCLPCAQGRHPVTGVCGRVGSAGVCRCSCWADPSDGRDRYELSRMIDPEERSR